MSMKADLREFKLRFMSEIVAYTEGSIKLIYDVLKRYKY